MVDPNVFEAVGYDPAQVSGFAFGVGADRVAMVRHGIDDIRLLYENDLRRAGSVPMRLAVKLPLSWLAEFIDLPTTDPAKLSAVLGSLGHEVEGWETTSPSFERGGGWSRRERGPPPGRRSGPGHPGGRRHRASCSKWCAAHGTSTRVPSWPSPESEPV